MAFLPTIGIAQGEVPRSDPLIYGLASFVIPGFGQYLNDQPGKALTHFILALAIPAACYTVTSYAAPFFLPQYYLCGLAYLGWSAYSAIDAYETAKRINRRRGLAFYLTGW